MFLSFYFCFSVMVGSCPLLFSFSWWFGVCLLVLKFHLTYFIYIQFKNETQYFFISFYSQNNYTLGFTTGFGCICLTFLHCVFSNGSSNRLPEKMHSRIGC